MIGIDPGICAGRCCRIRDPDHSFSEKGVRAQPKGLRFLYAAKRIIKATEMRIIGDLSDGKESRIGHDI